MLAPAAGRVVLVGWELEGFEIHGNTIGIDHGQGVVSIMIHLSQIYVQEGEMVQAGSGDRCSGDNRSVYRASSTLGSICKWTVSGIRFLGDLKELNNSQHTIHIPGKKQTVVVPCLSLSFMFKWIVRDNQTNLASIKNSREIPEAL